HLIMPQEVNSYLQCVWFEVFVTGAKDGRDGTDRELIGDEWRGGSFACDRIPVVASFNDNRAG
ncbi:MAG: hypothetical protein Q6361_04605, partial [Candidatus Hermodarchaeota archaeon]|nr:hypothetical protein [Candidatus Hermodarchaeota archaeon]